MSSSIQRTLRQHETAVKVDRARLGNAVEEAGLDVPLQGLDFLQWPESQVSVDVDMR